MAPVTRSRRDTKTTESPATKKSKTSTPKPDSKKPEKRKATEDATPIAAKKQKATKDAVAAPSPKPTPKSDKSTPKTTRKEEKKSTQKPVKENKKQKKEKPAQKEKKTKEPTPEPEAQEKEDDNEEEEEELDEETQALVENLDGGDEEKEDDKQISTFKKGQDVGKIPKKKTNDDSATKGSGKRGVMYLGRIPHGFYEHEIRAYFGQFGEITRLRVVRNKKTGASRHRAFVEFADAEVADIAARTMDKYLLFGHILTAKVVPQAQVHKDLFKGANRRFKVIPWNKMAGKQLDKALPESKWQAKITKEEQRRAARAAKLAEMDYEWEAPQLKAAEAKEPALLTAAEEEPVKAIEAPAVEEKKTEEKAEPEVAENKEEETKEEEPKSTKKRAAATPKKAAATPKKAAGTTPKKAAAAATPKAEATTPARTTRSTRKTKA
ncbi:hypothetical protein QBC32DRAFT_370495 [Pseudoneurospora amorphoporcata]|uniref:RRM domain-containing protein n=1 Tax=Pseudoneurospora amorphoporcata TaxID=241081 RepID=A0AAN6NXZ8_9PEZI|nr:hypothetical protein QBC32DRAFT_370495 [Pseudoneurospora amorphoporcata]